MLRTRFFKLISLVLVAAMLLLGFGYWWMRRSLPIESGQVRLPLQANVTVTRDGLGVPTISGRSLPDLYMAQGFVTAQDRLWQMDALRRSASGRLAEVIGRSMVARDIETRTLGMDRLAERFTTLLSARDRQLLDAYATGVNAYMNQAAVLPPEFAVLGYQPEPWRPTDTILVALEMMRTLTNSWRRDVTRGQLQHLLAEGGPKRLLPEVVIPGSNAWVLSGKHTASGQAMLANDPHLAFGQPGIWYMTELVGLGTKGQPLHTKGFTIPGIAGIAIGRNAEIAWGITNLHFDQQDVYLDGLDEATGKYTSGGTQRQAQRREFTVKVKGEAAQVVSFWETHHGPVMDTEKQDGRTVSLAVRWNVAGYEKFPYSIADLNEAKDFAEFREALRAFPFAGSNFLYADRAGNIGYQAMGLMPLRGGDWGGVPIDGSRKENEWLGWVPFDELPSVFNPPAGRFASANQNPFPASPSYPVRGEFARMDRFQRIEEQLRSHESWKPEENVRLQGDVFWAEGLRLARETAEALHKETDADLVWAAGELAKWNGQMEPQQVAPLLVRLLVETREAAGTTTSAKQLMQTVIAKVTKEQGTNRAAWHYGAINRLQVSHPVWSQVPLLGGMLRLAAWESGGGAQTVKQTSSRILPSMRMVVDFGDAAGGQWSLVVGQSGHPLSPHYADQWESYKAVRAFPMDFGKAAVAATLQLVPAN